MMLSSDSRCLRNPLSGIQTLCFSLSGGKDSTATYLHCLETDLIDDHIKGGGDVVRVFADTGWELQETYDYVDSLERRFGKIHRVATWVPGPGESKPEGFDHMVNLWATQGKTISADRFALVQLLEARLGRYSPMIRMIMTWAKMPSTVRRWCTDDTKRRPLVDFLASLDSPISIIGVRAEESKKRADMSVLEWSDDWDCWVYRPIHQYTLADVIAIHNRHGIAPNPLYLQGKGAGRVGCAPCVNSGKDDLMWLNAHHAYRLDLLHEIERCLDEDLISPRALSGAGSPRWFIGKNADREFEAWPLAKAIEWAHTARGGRQHILFRGEDEPGCAQWGLCETGRRA